MVFLGCFVFFCSNGFALRSLREALRLRAFSLRVMAKPFELSLAVPAVEQLVQCERELMDGRRKTALRRTVEWVSAQVFG